MYRGLYMSSPKAYLGKDKYIFVSYAHIDKDKVYPVISKLQEKYNVWFDEGIKWGKEWDVEIVQKLSKCSLFLYLVSEKSLKSNNCKDEISYAKDSGLPFINVCIEQVELPEEFKFRYGRYQMCFLYSFHSLDEFLSDFISRVGKMVDLEVKENIETQSKPHPVLDLSMDMFHAAYTEHICQLNNQPCPEISKETLLKMRCNKNNPALKGYFPFLTMNLKNVSQEEVSINTAIYAVGSFQVGRHIDETLLINEYSFIVNKPIKPGEDFQGYLAGPFLISFIEAILKDKAKSIMVKINNKEHYYPIAALTNVVDYIKENFSVDMIERLKGEDILNRFIYALKIDHTYDFYRAMNKEDQQKLLISLWAGSQSSIDSQDLGKAFGLNDSESLSYYNYLVEQGILSPIADNQSQKRKVINQILPSDCYPTITFGYPPMFIE